MRSRAVGLGVALLLLAGCGSDGPSSASDQPPETTYTGSYEALGPSAEMTGPSATASPQSASPSDLSGLAAAAQSQATSVPSSAAVPPQSGPVEGGDISWPQCPPGLGIAHKETKGLPLPTSDATYVVIGLTNGPGFHANPCLADQVAYAREQGLLTAAYSVISWPDAATQARYGGLREAGRAQAEFNVASVKAAGLRTPVIWLDVEPVPYYDWPTGSSAQLAQNAEVVRGAAEAYVDAGYRIGVYSTPYLWQGVVGDLALGVPEWRAAGETSRAEALSRCGPDWSIQGGPSVLGQWVEDGRDKNVTCPGVGADLGKWFAAP